VEVFVAEDEIAFLRKTGGRGDAREIATAVHMAGFAPQEGGELFFELNVVGARTVGRAGPCGAGSPLAQRSLPRLDDFGVKGEAEVVVAREHDHVAPTELDAATLLRLNDMVVRVVFEPHLRGVVVATAIQERLGVLRLGKEGQGHRCKSGGG